MELVSEFAAVKLDRDDGGNGPRLRIEDLRTGHVGYLDPLELETLAWLPEGAFHKFLDPSFHRWREPDVAGGPDSRGPQAKASEAATAAEPDGPAR